MSPPPPPYYPFEVGAYPDPVPGAALPTPGGVTAVDDGTSVTGGQTVTVDPLANDSAADGSPLFLLSVDQPASGEGTLSVSGNRVTYTAPASFNGTVSVAYRAASSTGGQDQASIVFTVSAATASKWGPGPKSGFDYWLGCRAPYGTSYYSIADQENHLNRQLDIMDVWVNYQQMDGLSEANGWKWIAGCDPAQSVTAHTVRGGVFTGGWNKMWFTGGSTSYDPKTQPMKANVALNPKPLSTKAKAGETVADVFWKFWFNVAAAGNPYLQYYKALGKRCAYLDDLQNIRCGTSGGPSGASDSTNHWYYDGKINKMPQAARFIVWGWEINDSQRWAYFGWQAPSAYTDPAGNVWAQGTHANKRVGTGLARMFDAFNDGYYSYASKNCPYYHGTRATARRQGGPGGGKVGIREVLRGKSAADGTVLIPALTTSQASLFAFVGQSQHNTELSPTDAAPNALRNINNANLNLEGLDQIRDLADDFGWAILLDETGQHFGPAIVQGSNPPRTNAKVTESGSHPDYFYKGLHDFLIANPGIRGGLHFYQGDGITVAATATQPGYGVSDTSLIKSPARGFDPGVGGNGRWAQAAKYYTDTWKKVAAP